ncbi:uncharacterized protein LOC102729490 isoform X2 [Leptonychotes weddellii]|uniref:Uncharacterized protein LOC102729490 isoform X2 n=1 Tax=Leptonychotes weddellii TaxID=9713 RepID=A0A7F8Q1J5_LEPWE|nr:uncharacterized protein LOC102729490 isoform X2 [Leptonychotes weddellii]
MGASPYPFLLLAPTHCRCQLVASEPGPFWGPAGPSAYPPQWGTHVTPACAPSLHLQPAAVCTCVRLPGRPAWPQSHSECWDPALVGGRPLQLLHLAPGCLPGPRERTSLDSLNGTLPLLHLPLLPVTASVWGTRLPGKAFLALLPVPGSRGHRLGQLLHHRAHRPGRPLCEGPADPSAGHLLHLHPYWKVMPCLEAVALILLIALVPDPPRGAAEKQEEVAVGDPRSSWCEDVSWSFVWSTLGVTAIAFVTGVLGFWAPRFLLEAHVVHGLQLPCLQDLCNNQDSLIFGILTVVTGIIGVVLGAEASRRYKKVNPRAEPLICACSLLIAAPCLYLALILAPVTLLASYGGPGQPGHSVATPATGSRLPASAKDALPSWASESFCFCKAQCKGFFSKSLSRPFCAHAWAPAPWRMGGLCAPPHVPSSVPGSPHPSPNGPTQGEGTRDSAPARRIPLPLPCRPKVLGSPVTDTDAPEQAGLRRQIANGFTSLLPTTRPHRSSVTLVN